MPSVPSYDRSIVQQAALPNARVAVDAPIEAFGGGQSTAGVTGAVGNIANTFEKIAGEEKKKADDAIVTDRYASLLKDKNDMIYNPQTGAMSKKGENAMGVITEYGDKFNARAKELEDSLNNEDQKQFFRKMVIREGVEFNGLLNKHVAQESEILSDKAFTSGIEAIREDVISNYAEPGKIAQGIERQKVLLANQAAKKGLPVDSEQFQEILSQTHKGVLFQMMNNGQDQLAGEYFKQIKKEFTSQDLISVTKLVEEGSTLGESQRLAKTIIAKYPDEQEAIAAAQNISNPKVQKATVDLISQNFTLVEKAKKNAQEKHNQSVADLLTESEGKANLTPQMLLGLSIPQAEAAKKWKRDLLTGEEPPPNGPTYMKYRLMAAQDRENFAGATMNSPEILKEMTKAEGKDLVDLWIKVREKDGTVDDALNAIDSNEKIKQEVMEKIGVSNSSWWTLGFGKAKPDSEKLYQFNLSVDEAIRGKEAGLKRKLTHEEVGQVVNNFATEFVTSKKNQFVGTVKPEDLNVRDIPKDDLDKLHRQMMHNGWPINDQNVRELYVKGLRQGVFKPNAK